MKGQTRPPEVVHMIIPPFVGPGLREWRPSSEGGKIAPHLRFTVQGMVIEQVRSGRSATEVARTTGVSQATVFRWVRLDRVHRGELTGTSTAQSAGLRAAKARIADLEAELATVKRASELFSKGRVVHPKELHGLVATLVAEGHVAKRCCRILAIASAGYFRSPTAPLRPARSGALGWRTASPRCTPGREGLMGPCA